MELRPREYTVLQLMPTCTRLEIARILALHPGTVNKYQEAVYRYLDSQNRCEAVMKAIELGLIEVQTFIGGAREGVTPLLGGEGDKRKASTQEFPYVLRCNPLHHRGEEMGTFERTVLIAWVSYRVLWHYARLLDIRDERRKRCRHGSSPAGR